MKTTPEIVTTPLAAPDGLSTTSATHPTGVAERPASLLLRAIAAIALVVLGMRIVLPQGVEVGFLISAALTPLWFGAIRRFLGMRLVIALALLAAGAGIWLQIANSGDHVVDAGIATSTTVLLIGFALSIGLVVWARTLFSVPTVALFFGIGLLFDATNTAHFASNPWKFGLAIPASLILLAVAKMTGRWWVEMGAILVLVGISAASDSRSIFGLLLLAAVLLVAQLPVFRVGHGGSAFLVSLGVIVVSIVVYNVGQTLVLSGILGESTTARSLAQFDASGSLVLGGRPELGATIALIGQRAWGLGAGVSPTSSEVVVAKEGMQAIGYDPNNGYVERYMFGGHVELHSIFGDVWAQAGLFGLALVVVVAGVLILGLTRNMADGTASGLLLYVVASSLWDLLFSPFFSAERLLVLSIGLVAVPVARFASQRVNSTTESIGPMRRLPDVNPSRAKTAASRASEAAG